MFPEWIVASQVYPTDFEPDTDSGIKSPSSPLEKVNVVPVSVLVFSVPVLSTTCA